MLNVATRLKVGGGGGTVQQNRTDIAANVEAVCPGPELNLQFSIKSRLLTIKNCHDKFVGGGQIR